MYSGSRLRLRMHFLNVLLTTFNFTVFGLDNKIVLILQCCDARRCSRLNRTFCRFSYGYVVLSCHPTNDNLQHNTVHTKPMSCNGKCISERSSTLVTTESNTHTLAPYYINVFSITTCLSLIASSLVMSLLGVKQAH